ncbi:MAG: hypothetical protein RL701_2602 [Pseudomonadota bacterium]
MRMQAWTLKCGSRFACGAALAALLGACGQEASTTPSTDTASASDSASAYQALSASLKACDDKKEACITAAVADATKLAACDAAAVSCEDKTQAAASNAHKRLCDEAEDCVSKGRGGRGPGRGRGNDEDGGVGDDVHTCIEHRAPSAPPCLKDLFTCLDATGLQQSSPQTQLDQAAKDAIVACVTTAHACIVDDMSSHRPGHSGGFGGAGGRPSFPGVGGRGHRDEAGSDAAGSSAQSPWGQGPGKGQGVAGHGFGGAPWTHDEAGSDADDDDNKGPGQAGAGGRRRGGRGGAGGAAGN